MISFSRIFIFFIFLSVCMGQIQAQIGVNTDNPFEHSELDIQNEIVDGNVVPKGILIPRMTSSERNSIDILSSVDNLNSLLIYNTDEDCYNYFSKSEKEWRSLCGKEGYAEFDPVDCKNIAIVGNYVQGTDLNASNYLTITLNVTKVGSYAISAMTSNGYYFTASGVALVSGEYTIRVPSFGTPTSAGTDDLVLSGIKLSDASCIPTVKVQPLISNYTINCDNITVVGDYYKNVALTASNYITIPVNVSSLGSYYISTETVNGVSFVAQGEFTSLGLNYVNLYGTGTPTINDDFDVKIVGNSPLGSSECSTTIPIILPAMTYASIGLADNVYTWGPNTNAFQYGVRSLVLQANASSFSKTGVVRMESFTELWNTTDGITAGGYLTNGYMGKFPDVILFYAIGLTGMDVLAPALAEYIKKGGCVIYGTADYGTYPTSVPNTKTLLTDIFGSKYGESVAAINTVGTKDDSGQDIYPLADNPSDPILNGPFGNASGQYWGEDNAGSVVTTALPPNSVQLASANNNVKKIMDPAISIVWYNNSYNFVYFGDCVGASVSDISTFFYPAYYPNYKTGTKAFGSQGLRRYVYNSVLELNAVAWCIRKAVVSGINPY